MDWLDQANCVGKGDIFFEKARNGVYLHKDEALKACAECEVSTACLDYAMTDPSNQGVWAGSRESGRVALEGLRQRDADRFWAFLEGALEVVASDAEQATMCRMQGVL